MRIDNTEGVESVRISHFSREEGGSIQINDIDLGVPSGTSVFAVAAMLKGFEEYFLIPTGQNLTEEFSNAVKHNLEVFNKNLKPEIISVK